MKEKREMGSITVFVLGVLILFTVIIAVIFIGIKDKADIQEKEINKIQEEYGQNDENKIEQVYEETINK